MSYPKDILLDVYTTVLNFKIIFKIQSTPTTKRAGVKSIIQPVLALFSLVLFSASFMGVIPKGIYITVLW